MGGLFDKPHAIAEDLQPVQFYKRVRVIGIRRVHDHHPPLVLSPYFRHRLSKDPTLTSELCVSSCLLFIA